MNIYIAGFFDTRERIRPYRDLIRAMGHTVLSTWIDEPNSDPATLSVDESRRIALRDIGQIRQADMLILDTIDPTPRGGREVELGFTLARMAVTIWHIGPRRNVFHSLLSTHFEDWPACLAALEKRRSHAN